MKCSYCSRQLSAKAPQVVIIINDDSSQAYCGSPEKDSVDGLSCWQEAIQAWNRLIAFEQAATGTSLENTHSVLRVRQAGVSVISPPASKDSNEHEPTAISRRRHRTSV